MYYLYTEQVVIVFGFSLSTIIRFGAVYLLFFATLFTNNFSANSKKLLLGYSLCIAAYSVLHHIATQQISLTGKELKYSLLHELLYIRRLGLPVIIIFITYNLKVSPVMIIKSLTNDTINANVFSWFTDGYLKYGFSTFKSQVCLR